MARVTLLAVGKIREKFYKEGIEEYAKRLSRYTDFGIKEVSDRATKSESDADRQQAIEKEGDELLPQIKGFCVVLDIGGTLMNSEQLASAVQKGLETKGDVTVVIGGSYGLDGRVKARADASVSFGRVTFPHQMVRLMATEQLYRSFTINACHPYHK